RFQDRYMGGSHHFIAEMLEEQFPEIKSAVRFAQHDNFVRLGERIIRMNLSYTDPEFFSLFSFPKAAGGSTSRFSPEGIVLTQEAAASLFGAADPLGKTVSVFIGRSYRDFIVSGLLENIPANSSIRLEAVLPFRFVFEAFDVDPTNNDFVTLPMIATTILDIPDPAAVAALRPKLAAFNDRMYGPRWKRVNMKTPEQGMDVLPLTAYHLGDVDIFRFLPRSRRSYSLILGGIALLVLLLACFNAVNLALVSGTARLKEIGVRKVIGAERKQILGLLLSDAVLMSGLALVGAVGLTSLLLPSFNAFTGKQFSPSIFFQPSVLLMVAGALTSVILLTGVYPALDLSRFSAAALFREKGVHGRRHRLSRALIVFQFAVSVFLVFGLLVMSRQLHFMTTADLGYDPSNILIMETQVSPNQQGEGTRILEIFRNELKDDPRVLSVTADSGTVGDAYGGITRRFDQDGVEHLCEFYLVAAGYMETLKIPISAGRPLSFDDAALQRDEVLVNQAFLKDFGVDDPIGLRMSEIAVDKFPPEYTFDPLIVGVVDDFYLSSLHDPIFPMAFGSRGFPVIQRLRNVIVRVQPEEGVAVLGAMDAVWKRIKPDLPFSAEFLDDKLAGYYGQEKNWSRIVGWSAAFALLIACMGLFGLTGINVARRTKETGIRKVLGAGAGDILLLFSKDLLVWIVVANLLAWPAAYYAAQRWLGGFANRVDIGIGTFVVVGLLSLLIAGLTVSWHVGRAALSDPVHSLRYE
ncbi:MAG: ABC transporter permease, partial [Candidatus Aminicenantes bacterium]|nr:ABC transporter permease [Candidatus Aminicenantes bacterium]